MRRSFPPQPAAGRSAYRVRGILCRICCWFCSRCTFLLGTGLRRRWTLAVGRPNASLSGWFRCRNPLILLGARMEDWIDYYDSTHTIYASKLHRDLHFQIIARDIIGYISSPDSVVLDYACGEALSAAKVADACGKLYLAEPAPGVRGRLIARFAPNTKIRVRSLDDLRKMDES